MDSLPCCPPPQCDDYRFTMKHLLITTIATVLLVGVVSRVFTKLQEQIEAGVNAVAAKP